MCGYSQLLGVVRNELSSARRISCKCLGCTANERWSMPGAFCHRPSVCSGVVGVVEILKFNVCVRHGIKPAKYQDLGDILKLQRRRIKAKGEFMTISKSLPCFRQKKRSRQSFR